MRRVVSVWLPHWPTDRLRKRRAAPPGETAVVTAVHDGRRRVVVAADAAAVALGLRPGMAVAHAQALVPGLGIVDAELEGDAAALCRLARWCHAITPLVAPCPADGLWLDVTGSAHLFGGEAALLDRVVARLGRDGVLARTAVADTPGCAHALARHGGAACTVIPPGGQERAMAALPVGALRIAPELEATLCRLGFETVGHLARIPRNLVGRRFGSLPGLRLDQAHGRVEEPLVPLAPEQALQSRATFVEPLLTAEAFATVIGRLMPGLCARMEAEGLGARQLDLLFERIDGQVVAIRVGTARASRDAGHLARMLVERLETVDPGPGVEAMRLVAPLAETLRWEQQAESGGRPVAQLIDRLSNRLGAARVYRAMPIATDCPERMSGHGMGAAWIETGPGWDEAAVRVATPVEKPVHLKAVDLEPGPLKPAHLKPVHLRPVHLRPVHLKPGHLKPVHLKVVRLRANHMRVVGRAEGRLRLEDDPPLLDWRKRHERGPVVRSVLPWPNRLVAPARLLAPPHPIQALAQLPEEPPVAFTWRKRHRVRRAEGPERIFGEWWRGSAGVGDLGTAVLPSHAVRDYYIVEDEDGQRFWLFRRGNGIDPRTGDLRWFLHGLF